MIFSLCTRLVIPAWLLLILAPRWRWTKRLVWSGALPILFGTMYLALIVGYYPTAQGGFGSLAQVLEIFRNPHIVLAGWIHYLAFDLFVGTWEVRDAQRLAIPHVVVVPCLALTLLFGPIGLLSYLAIRLWLRRTIAIEL